jgi:hypothetical protein
MSCAAAIESRKLGREEPAARWGSSSFPLFVLLTATVHLPGRTPTAGEGGEVPGSQQGREVRRGGGKAAGKGGARSERGRRCAQRVERLRKKLKCGVHMSTSAKGTI